MNCEEHNWIKPPPKFSYMKKLKYICSICGSGFFICDEKKEDKK